MLARVVASRDLLVVLEMRNLLDLARVFGPCWHRRHGLREGLAIEDVDDRDFGQLRQRDAHRLELFPGSGISPACSDLFRTC